jgi:hypothetical protein
MEHLDENRHIIHHVFLDTVREIMDDFGLDEESACNVAHEWMTAAGDINSPSARDFLNTPIEGCSHCQ